MDNRRESIQTLPGIDYSHELGRAYVDCHALGFETWLGERAEQVVLQARQYHAILSAQHALSPCIPDTELVVIKEQLAYAEDLVRLQHVSELLRPRLARLLNIPADQAVNTVDFTKGLGINVMCTVTLFQQSLINRVGLRIEYLSSPLVRQHDSRLLAPKHNVKLASYTTRSSVPIL